MPRRPKSETMLPSPSRPPSNQWEAAIQELMKGTELARKLRQQVELITELDCREAAVANVSEISDAMESSLSILQSESEHFSGAGSMTLQVGCAAYYSSDCGSSARNGAVSARARKMRHRRGRLEEELPVIKEIQTDAPENDRFPWRKYGEKKILNAEYTRLYYKCGNSNNHSKCPAKKYVQQQSNSNPPLFLVTFINEHTCRTFFPEEPSSSSDSTQVIDFTKPSLSSPLMEGAPVVKQEEESSTLIFAHKCGC